jgi:DNA polymerase-3 subunit beta
MDIQVDKLRQTLALVAAAIPRGRVSLAITTSVLFDQGKVTATNLEYWISADLPELGDAGFVLPHGALTEALKYTPGREAVTLTSEEERVVLTTSGSRLSLVKPGQPHDFPPMPAPSGEPFVVDGDRLVSGLLRVQPYTSTDSARPVMTGVAMKLGEELEIAGADGYRLAVHQTGIKLNGGETGHMANVPGNVVKVLGRLWRRGDKPPDIDAAHIAGQTASGGSLEAARLAVARRNIRMVEDGNHIRFSFGGITLCSALIQGQFPGYEYVIPETAGGRKVSVSAEELLRAVNQVEEIASGGNNICRLRWTANQLVVSSRSSDVGEAEVTLPAIVEGEEAEIAFNLGYLQSYLQGKDHVVTIATSPGTAEQVRSSMGVFTHRGSPMVIMMPMVVGGTAESASSGPEGPEAQVAEDGPQTEEPAETSATETQPAPRRRRRRGAAS